jgi:hypothetical protein
VRELVIEDVEHTLAIMDMRDFEACATEEEVRIRAEAEADGIAATLQDSILLPDPVMVHNESVRQKWDAFCTEFVSDHRGSNSQVIDFEMIKAYPIFTAKLA